MILELLEVEKMDKVGKYKDSKVFKNKKALSIDYTPEEIVHREEQLDEIDFQVISEYIKDKGDPNNLIICGGTGTGKSVTIKKAIDEIKKGDLDITPLYIDCNEFDNQLKILGELVKGLLTKSGVCEFEYKGRSRDDLYQKIEDEIKKNKLNLWIILDEVDQVLDKDKTDELIRRLHRIKETGLSFREGEETKGNLSITAITNSIKFKEYLKDKTKERLNAEILIFPHYNIEELEDILKQRIEKAFEEDIVKEDAIILIGGKGKQEGGNARYVLQVLRKAGELAERREKETIDAQLCKDAKELLEVDLLYNSLRAVSEQERAVAYSLFLMVDKEERPITTSELYSGYKKVCDEKGIFGRSKRRVADYIGSLETQDIVNTWNENKGREGRKKKINLAGDLELFEKAIKRVIKDGLLGER